MDRDFLRGASGDGRALCRDGPDDRGRQTRIVFQMPTFTEVADAPELDAGWHASEHGEFSLSAGTAARRLGVVDDDLSSHAEWHLVRDVAPRVVPAKR